MILSDVSLGYLFSNEKPTEMYTNDEHRALMDDLRLTKDSVSAFRSFKASLELFVKKHFK